MSESIAILSDIHANLPALEAVLEDIESQGIREILCLGDVVGYAAQPAECIELLRSTSFLTILRGNHDAYAASEVEKVCVAGGPYKKSILLPANIIPVIQPRAATIAGTQGTLLRCLTNTSAGTA